MRELPRFGGIPSRPRSSRIKRRGTQTEKVIEWKRLVVAFGHTSMKRTSAAWLDSGGGEHDIRR